HAVQADGATMESSEFGAARRRRALGHETRAQLLRRRKHHSSGPEGGGKADHMGERGGAPGGSRRCPASEEQRTDHGQHARELSEAIVGPEHPPYHLSTLSRTQPP